MSRKSVSQESVGSNANFVPTTPLAIRIRTPSIRQNVNRSASQGLIRTMSELGLSGRHEYDAPLSSAGSDVDVGRYSNVPPSVVQARHNALRVLSTLRSSLLFLELTRMRKSRIGLRSWTFFWRRVYKSDLADGLQACIWKAFPKIDKIFRTVARKIYDLSYAIGKRMAAATTETQIICLWKEMESHIISYRQIRQIRVLKALEELRVNMEKVPFDVAEPMWDDLKRGVFALDPYGEYHPGDKWSEHCDELYDEEVLNAEQYVRNDPEIVLRPGFTEEFHEALVRAAEQTEELDVAEIEPDEEMALSESFAGEISRTVSFP